MRQKEDGEGRRHESAYSLCWPPQASLSQDVFDFRQRPEENREVESSLFVLELLEAASYCCLIDLRVPELGIQTPKESMCLDQNIIVLE